MTYLKTKPRFILLTRNKPESGYFKRTLSKLDSFELVAIIYESDRDGKANLVRKKINNLYRKKKYLEIFILLINLPFLFFIEKYTHFYLSKYFKIKNKTEKIIEYNIKNLNSEESQEIIRTINPDFLLVYGTRILKKEIFSLSNKGALNLHVGITPEYRGSKSEFWSLYNNERNMVGYTAHLIDEGIDTGNIIFQKKISVNNEDNFLSLRAKNILDISLNIETILGNFYNKTEFVCCKKRKNKFYSTPYLHHYLKIIFKNIFRSINSF